LGREWIDDLSDVAFRVFVNSLMWCNANGTDGRIPRRYLRLLHRDGERINAAAELVNAGLWLLDDDGWQMPRWAERPGIGHRPSEDTGGMGQELAANVADQMERRRRNQANYRQRNSGAPPKEVSADVTGHVTDHVSTNVGQGPGTEKKGDYGTVGIKNQGSFDDAAWLAGEPASVQPPRPAPVQSSKVPWVNPAAPELYND